MRSKNDSLRGASKQRSPPTNMHIHDLVRFHGSGTNGFTVNWGMLNQGLENWGVVNWGVVNRESTTIIA